MSTATPHSPVRTVDLDAWRVGDDATRAAMREPSTTFIENLDLNDNVKSELLAITPFNYTGF